MKLLIKEHRTVVLAFFISDVIAYYNGVYDGVIHWRLDCQRRINLQPCTLFSTKQGGYCCERTSWIVGMNL
jgi:hypothetical protein